MSGHAKRAKGYELSGITAQVGGSEVSVSQIIQRVEDNSASLYVVADGSETAVSDGLTVVLKGQNTFRPQKNEPDAFVEFFNGGQMTITGNGTLNLICSNKEITETNGNWGNIYDFNLDVAGLVGKILGN